MNRLAILGLALTLGTTTVFADAWDKGVAAFSGKDYATAVRYFEKIVAKKPEFYGGHYMLGISLARVDRETEAINHLDRAHELKPDDVAIKLELGHAYIRTKRYQDAIAIVGSISTAEIAAMDERKAAALRQLLLTADAGQATESGSLSGEAAEPEAVGPGSLGSETAESGGCLKLVFGKYCLGGSVEELPDGATATGPTQNAWRDPEGVTYVQIHDGRVAWVLRQYQPASWLTFDTLLGKLKSRYGDGVRLDRFPSHSDTRDNQATSIRIGRGQAVQSWSQGEYRVRLVWSSRDHVELQYVHEELTAAVRAAEIEAF